MVKFIMHGCNGAMGQVITRLAKEDSEAEIVAGIDIQDTMDNGYPVFTNIDDCDVPADVIVDFSVAKAVDAVVDYAVKRQMPLVLCTTGLSEEQLAHVAEASRKVAILRSANMSLGVNTVFKLAAIGAQVLYWPALVLIWRLWRSITIRSWMRLRGQLWPSQMQ